MKPKKNTTQRKYGGIRADLRTEERRRKIISAGLELFGTVGYAHTSIKKICLQAGLTERYFYESFPGKEDLLIAVYRRVVEKLNTDSQALITGSRLGTTSIGQEALTRYLQNLQDDPRIARILFFEILGVSPRIDLEYQKAIQVLSGNTLRLLLMAFPSLASMQLDRTVLPTAMAGAIIQVASQWVLSGFQPPLEEILTQVKDLFHLVEELVAGRIR